MPLRERTKSSSCPSRAKRGDSSAKPAGGCVSCRCEPLSPTCHNAQCVWKKFASVLLACDWTTSERPPGAQASDPQERPVERTSERGRQDGGVATSSRLSCMAIRSPPPVKTNLPAHQVK